MCIEPDAYLLIQSKAIHKEMMNKDNKATMTLMDHPKTNLMNQRLVDIPTKVVRITASGGSNHSNQTRRMHLPIINAATSQL
jgi:hypothetical protein